MKKLFAILAIATLPLFSEYETVPDQSTLKVETPSLQKRQTEKLRLENGMNVYLISDPDADKSGAAVTVSAGSWNDPEEYPGMAHFCEHMLFLGTKKYPSDDEAFMTYVHDQGGVVNAYTASDHTNYMFSINNDQFETALDQFAHFFIDPLFKNSGVRRELHAVDQEHAKNIEHDGWRQWMILKETGNPDHPNASFSTGNAETLGHIPREALIDWYQVHYSGNQMNLVLYSPLPMDELKKLAVSDFKDVPNWDADSLPPYATLTSDKQRGHMIYIEPVRDIRELSLVWEVPREFAIDQDSKVAELISYVLQDGSEKSLEKVLKDRHLAEGVHASVDRNSSENALFEISVSLTKEGTVELSDVITTCFEAINLLKKSGIPPYVYNEMETMTKLSYNYQSRESAFNTVKDHARNLVYEELETYPQKTLLAKDFYPQKVDAFVDLLTPQSCIYIVTAPSSLTGVKPDKKEKWLGGEYTTKEISKSYLTAWNRAQAHGAIALPKPNPYIPTYLTLVNRESKNEQSPHPVHIANDDKGSVYFWGDTEYRVPEVAWTFAIKTPKIDGTSKATVLGDLYVRAVQEKAMTLLSSASRGGLSASVSASPLKLSLSINGYSEKAGDLLTALSEKMRKTRATEKEFNLYKESLASYYESATKALPIQQAVNLVSHTLFSHTPLPTQLINSLNTITYEEYVAFEKDLFETAYVEGMLSGNCTEKNAKAAWKTLEQTLASAPYPKKNHIEKEVLVLPGEGPFMIAEETTTLGNSALLALQEGTATIEKKSAQVVLGKALSSDFFATLRTKQQTAYIAKGWSEEVENQLFQFFAVQSSTHHPDDLLSRFEMFLEDYVKDFTTAIPKERFESLRLATIESLTQPPTNLDIMNARLFRFAFDRDGNFDYIQQLTASLKDLTYDDFTTFAKTYLSRQNGQRLAVLYQGILPPQNDFRYHRVTSESIRQQGRFVTSNL